MMKTAREMKKIVREINVPETIKKAYHSYELTVQIAETVLETSKLLNKIIDKLIKMEEDICQIKEMMKK